jgi:hypothetical protein
MSRSLGPPLCVPKLRHWIYGLLTSPKYSPQLGRQAVRFCLDERRTFPRMKQYPTNDDRTVIIALPVR